MTTLLAKDLRLSLDALRPWALLVIGCAIAGVLWLRMPESLMDSGRAMSVHIYLLAMGVMGGDRNAYACALVLVGLLLLINLVAVWIGEAYAGTPFEASYQDVILPRAEVFRVEHRQLDKVRTGLVAAGAVAVIAYLIDSVGVFDIFPSRGPGTPPEPPEILISR